MQEEPRQEHRWLQKLVGEWTYEVEAPTEPGGEPETATGTESVRPLGDLWVRAEGSGEMPDGSPATTLMTLGYDSRRERYVGTWIGSMATYLWVYDGELDEAAGVLTLEAEGPDMAGTEEMARYRDVIELDGDDRRVLRALVLRDGEWRQFMVARYRRKT